MPIHDWRRVHTEAFHGFHSRWITTITTALNTTILPEPYYADGERIANNADEFNDALLPHPPGFGPASYQRTSLPAIIPSPRHIVVRHTSGHKVVALIEIVSPVNKDSPARLAEFAGKVNAARSAGVHVVVLDLFPSGRSDPHATNEPTTFVSYAAGGEVEAFIEHPLIGAELPDMPLFLAPGRHVMMPLEPAYQLAWSGTPRIWRDLLESP